MPFIATILALTSILLWSFLGFLTASLTHLPPLLVVGIALSVSGLASAFRLRDWRVPIITFIVGVGGIFGYHFLYFLSFQHAPPVEANLMNYLWPLLIVFLSPFYLPGYQLRRHHLVGALMGFSGAVLIISGGKLGLDTSNILGYLLAAGAALVWASYSLLTKRLPPFPTTAVGGFCLASGLLSLTAFNLSDTSYSIRMLSTSDWIYMLLLAAGPMGGAFYTWDAALKRGDPRGIGSLAYLTPLTSTLILVLVGGRELSVFSAVAMLLIVSGAVIGSIDLIRNSPNQ